MRRIYFVLLILVAALSAMANPIDMQQARQQAEKFLQSKGATLSGESARAIGRKSSHLQQPLYVFNAADNRGFVIVAGDDRIEPIIGYTTQGSFDEGDLPDNFRAWLEQTAAEIEAIKNSPAQTSDVPASIAAAKKVSIHTAIDPLIITTWNQGNSSNDLNTDGVYNVHLPMINGQYPCTGCVATAGAQIMYYYHRDLPNMTQPVPGYKLTDKDGNDVSKGADTSADLPAIQFQWDKMKTKYSKDDPDADAVSAVADLMLYCAYAAHMNFGVDASSASTSTLAKGMSDYFDFNPNTWKSVYRRYYSISEWDELVYNELANGRPIIYSGSYSSGHAFICDGYDGAGMYHFNWGWGGNYNGYFKLQATNPYGDRNTSKMGYISENHCIIGLQPNSWPEIYYTDTDDTWEVKEIEGIVATASNITVENTTVSMRLSNNNEEAYGFGFGIGELNGDGTITPIDTNKENYKNTVLNQGYGFPNITFDLSSYNLSDGVHNIVPISIVNGESEWRRCKPADLYFEVRVSGGTCSIIPHPIENLKINNFELASGGIPGQYQAVNVSITNNGDNIEERLYIYLGTADDNGKSAGSKLIKIASGNTKDYKYNIGKIDAGDYVLRLLNPQKEVLAEKAISIALDLKATKIEVADPKITSYDIKVVATVENRAGDYAVPLYLFASNGGEAKTFKYAAGSAIERGSSEDVTFYFKADKAGTWTLYITSDKDGNNVIGETTIEIAEAPTGTVELKLEGSSVKCSDNSVTYTMSIKNTGSTTNYQEIRTWLYQGEAFVASNYSPKVIIEPGETKSVSVSYEGLETGKDYNISINYSIQPVSWKGKWLGSYDFTFNPSEGGTTPGDANGDNKVDAMDIVDIVNQMMGKATSTGTFDMDAADLNNDNVVNAADIILLINMLVSTR